MADTVMRYQIADYINTGTESTETWSLMGVGFNTLDENPNAQSESKTYIHQKTQTSQIKSYNTQFPFDTDMVKDEAAVMALYNIGRNHKTGKEAELDYVRVDLYATPESGTSYPARKFRVSVEVSSVSGEGGGVVKAAGNLNTVGDFVEGTFDTSTKTFTAASASE